jgi:uncharacterized repeat protein (TIGR03803 family)
MWKLLTATLAILPIAAAQTSTKPSYQDLYAFEGNLYGPDGSLPESALAIAPGGALYGTTYNGGISAQGTVFSLAPPASSVGAWTETQLYLFKNGTDGAWPTAIVRAPNGVLYGLTSGYAEGEPTVSTAYSLTPPAAPGGAWIFQTIYTFTNTNIIEPVSLVLVEGVLYGTSFMGGISPFCQEFYGCGTFFSLTPPANPDAMWDARILYSFPGGNQAAWPEQVVPGPGGSFYGMASQFDICPTGCGEVFQLTPHASPGGSWTHKQLYAFTNANGDGQGWGGMALGSDGVIYGVTNAGGTNQQGTVFSLTPPVSPGGAWTEAILYRFGEAGDGVSPNAPPVVDSHGVIYGTTGAGGNQTCGCGVVFAMLPPTSPGGSWTEQILHRFNFSSGGLPGAGLSIDANGNLFGTTSAYGAYDNGAVFALVGGVLLH